MSNPESKKTVKKMPLAPLSLNRETVSNLTETEAEQVQGGLYRLRVMVSPTDVRSGNRCCSAPCA